MNKHTPGPWYVGTEFNDQGRHIYAEQKVRHEDGDEWHPLIACTDDDERLVNWQANAVLIAAAPDLLEVLQYFMPFIDSEQDDERQAPWVEKAHAAIAKATLTF
jgi:hypothetical protein